MEARRRLSPLPPPPTLPVIATGQSALPTPPGLDAERSPRLWARAASADSSRCHEWAQIP